MIEKELFLEKMNEIDPNKAVVFGYDEEFRHIHLLTNFNELCMRKLVQDCLDDEVVMNVISSVAVTLNQVVATVVRQRKRLNGDNPEVH
jgi:hypothetical protein